MKSIKIFFVLLAGMTFTISCSTMRGEQDFFNNQRLKSEANVTTLNVPMFLVKPFVRRHLKDEGQSEEVLNLVRKISKVRVMTVVNPSAQLSADFNKFLSNNNYEDWFTVNSADGEKINLHARPKGESINKLVFSVKSADELVLVDVSGLFTPEDLSKLISNLSQNQEVKK